MHEGEVPYFLNAHDDGGAGIGGWRLVSVAVGQYCVSEDTLQRVLAGNQHQVAHIQNLHLTAQATTMLQLRIYCDSTRVGLLMEGQSEVT